MPPSRAKVCPGVHQVVVYDDPLELVRTIGEFAVDALDRGGAVVLVARREHLEAVDEWVRLSPSPGARGGSVHGGGRYQTFDVDGVVSALDLVPDPSSAFEWLLDAACAAVPPGVAVVHIFGDLAATLWERGQVALALEIELMDARLVAERGVSVLCAYPASVLSGAGDLESVESCHSRVVPRSTVPSPSSVPSGRAARSAGGPDARLVPGCASLEPGGFQDVVASAKVFPGSIPACRAARRFVRATVEDSGGEPEIADAAELVCSELAVNAVRHAHSAFTVDVVCSRDGVRVAVTDENRSRAATPIDDRPAPFPVRTARGLGIVSALSADWGVEEQPEGTVVWADLGPPRGAASPASLRDPGSLS